MVEYLDNLSWDKQKELNAIVGAGPLGWKKKFPRLSREKKLEMGRIVFGQEVKNVRVTFEPNLSTGWDIPLIHAELP